MNKTVSFQAWIGKPLAAIALLLLGALALTACETAPAPAPIIVAPPPAPEPEITPEPEPEPEPELEDRRITPPHMADRRIVRAALLLPFSASSEGVRAEAASMLNAAQLALVERGGDSLLLIPKDTGGRASGARAAATAAIEEGADIILGPLFAESVTAAHQVASRRGVPVIAFSTDRSVAGDGAFLLSFPPDLEIDALLNHARSQGAQSVALLGPANGLTQLYDRELRGRAAEGRIGLTASEIYPRFDADASTDAITRLSGSRDSHGALIITASGDGLVELAPVLSFMDLSARDTLILGPGLWRNQDILRTMRPLYGAVTAGPDQEANQRFESAYLQNFRSEPSRLASLAYDAVSLAAFLDGETGRLAEGRLYDRNGFAGVDGLFRFGANGVAERALAIYELTPGGFVEIIPSPQSFPPDS